MDKHTEKLLRTIPGIGPAMARALYSLGVRAPEDLAGRDPRQLYDQLREMSGGKLDRCVLYVFREAVYYASTPPGKRDPAKLKWWNWKD